MHQLRIFFTNFYCGPPLLTIHQCSCCCCSDNQITLLLLRDASKQKQIGTGPLLLCRPFCLVLDFVLFPVLCLRQAQLSRGLLYTNICTKNQRKSRVLMATWLYLCNVSGLLLCLIFIPWGENVTQVRSQVLEFLRKTSCR